MKGFWAIWGLRVSVSRVINGHGFLGGDFRKQQERSLRELSHLVGRIFTVAPVLDDERGCMRFWIRV